MISNNLIHQKVDISLNLLHVFMKENAEKEKTCKVVMSYLENRTCIFIITSFHLWMDKTFTHLRKRESLIQYIPSVHIRATNSCDGMLSTSPNSIFWQQFKSSINLYCNGEDEICFYTMYHIREIKYQHMKLNISHFLTSQYLPNLWNCYTR